MSVPAKAKSEHVSDAGWASQLIEALEEFRKINQDVTANQVIIFLLIAMRPGISQKELMKLTELADGTVSRICGVLSDRGNRGTVGQGLIEIRPSPTSFRSTAQHLSPKGRRLLDAIRKAAKGR